jgi:hypothetical protein|tara:strand:- start:263 stop:529 length:267 start_codon:yes stop_codon:yes gene_type:complete
MKKLTLESKREVKIKEMSVDDIDFCNDLPQMRYENDQVVAITNLSKARTAWIRKGVDKADDKFIKSLSEDEKNELSLAVQEYQRLGED